MAEAILPSNIDDRLGIVCKFRHAMEPVTFEKWYEVLYWFTELNEKSKIKQVSLSSMIKAYD